MSRLWLVCGNYRCPFRFSLFGLIIASATATAGFAQNCDAVLRQGVFNTTTVSKGLTVQEDLFQWLISATDEQFTSARNNGLNFAATIYGIPFSLNGTSSQSEFHRLQTYVNQGLVKNFTQNEFLQIVELSASPTILQAWVACINKGAVGLVCSYTSNGDHIFTFSAKWAPNSITDLPPTVTTGGFQVSAGATYSGPGLPDSSQILLSGTSVILNRPGTQAVTVILNTTKGTCEVNIPAVGGQPTPPAVPPLVLRLFTAQSAISHTPQATLTVPPDYKIISGGARDNWTGFGNMLTASYPQDLRTWVARGKSQAVSDPSTIDLWAIALQDPNNLWQVSIQSSTSTVAAHPTSTATVPDGFTLTGGGAFAHWNTQGFGGSLLTASYPQDSKTWFAASKDHLVSEPVALTSYAIGIRPTNNAAMPPIQIFSSTSAVSDAPSSNVSVPSPALMLGGGAVVNYTGMGNMLTASFPSSLSIWSAASKAHQVSDPESIKVYAIGITIPPPPPCSYIFSPQTFSLGPGQATVNINVTTQDGCRWTVESTPSWILTATGTQFVGSGSVSLSISANSTSTTRSGSVNIAGQGVTFSQLGSSCDPPVVTPLVHPFSTEGGVGTVNVSTAMGCTWSVANIPTWLTVSSGGSGNGIGSFSFTVSRNDSSAQRSAMLTISGQTFTVTQAGTTLSGNRFIPVTPCRIADTRNPNGPFGGPPITGGTSRSFAIPSSACGIPPTASAYSINVTVVPRGLLGFLTVWPTGQTLPVASTLNSLDGRIKANAAIVPAGTAGAISVYAMHTTDVILDINGYFVPPANPSALAFFPLAPCRVVDTRLSPGSLGGPFLAGGQERSFPVRSSSCGIPATAQAYSLNFTAVPRGPLGHLTTWPTGSATPVVSTLNATTGQITANAAVVPAGDSGNISVLATNNTDLVIDVSGYFGPAGAGGLLLYNLTPCRVLDTRETAGSLPFSGVRNTNVAGSSCGVSAVAQAYVLSVTVVPSGMLGFLTLWPQGQAQPFVSTLNALDGVITSNMAIVPTTNGSITTFALNPTQLVLDISGFFAP